MKIEGFGQVNPVDTLKASNAVNDVSDFESILQKAYNEGDKEKLREACNEFEALMLQMLYKQMKAAIPDGGFIEKSTARSIFEDMLDETLMERASNRGMGISDMLYRQLSANMDKIYRTQSKEEGSDIPGPDGAESIDK